LRIGREQASRKHPRLFDQLRSLGAAYFRKARQGRVQFPVRAAQASSQMPGVFQGLARPLPRRGQRRMRRVAHQQHIGPAPCAQWLQVMHGDQMDGVRGCRANDAADRLRPCPEPRLDLLAQICCGRGPGQRPRLCRRPIDQPRPHRHGAKALARPPKILDGNVVNQCPACLGHAYPVHEALIDRRVVSRDEPPRHRIHAAVGADDQIRADARAILESRHGPAVAIQIDRYRAMAVFDRNAGPRRMVQQDRLQVAAQYRVGRIPHHPVQQPDIQSSQRIARGVLTSHRRWPSAHRRDIAQQPQFVQHEARIGPEGYAGAHGRGRRAAFVHAGHMPLFAQGQRHAQARDAAAQYSDFHLVPLL